MSGNAEPSSPNDRPHSQPRSGWGPSNGVGSAKIRFVAETGSTNADLLAAGRAGRTGPEVLVTGHQTAGRGRQDRTWFDEPGDSLLVSVLISADRSWADLVPLATGLAAVEAIDGLIGPAAALKWPNDVLVPALGERKLAGILVESTTVAERRDLAVVIGMGMNLRWTNPPPDDLAKRATTLTALWSRVSSEAVPDDVRSVVLDRYLAALEEALDTLAAPEGRSTTVDRYRRRCVTVGRPVSLTTPTGTVAGTAVDIGSGGELLVETAEGHIVPATAGEVRHRQSTA